MATNGRPNAQILAEKKINIEILCLIIFAYFSPWSDFVESISILDASAETVKDPDL
jgi:hypothetical protein